MEEVEKEDQAELQAWIERSEDDFLCFAQGLKIPAAHGARVFQNVMADFQRECFEDLAPSLHALKEGRMPPKRRFWIERTKKASKDTDVAVCICWLMAFCERPFLAQICAASSEQASIIENRVESILHYNPWLNKYIEHVDKQIRNRRQWRRIVCKVEATGTAGAAQGPTPDLLVLNELVHVDKWSVMQSHMNNADGVPQGVVIIATNAGIRGTQAETWRNNAMENPQRWTAHIWRDRTPWITKEDMEDARRRDPVGSEYKRLWRGIWVSGMGDALSDEDVDALFIHKRPLRAREEGFIYLGGLDLGINHDHAGISIIGVNTLEQRIRVARVKGFAPELPNDKGILEVDLSAVERVTASWSKQFQCVDMGYDPAAGGSYMAQRLRAVGVPMREQTFSTAQLTLMAKALVTAAKAGVLECYEDAEGRLRRDLGKFSISHKPPSGYKLEAISDEHGHADVGTALVIALPQAVEMLGGFDRLLASDILADPLEDFQDLEEAEVDDLPPELRDIWDAEEEMAKDAKRGAFDWDEFDY